MNSKDRQTFLSLQAKAIEDRIKRYRQIRNGQAALAAVNLRGELIAKGIIKPSTLTGMDRARELCQAAIAEVK